MSTLFAELLNMSIVSSFLIVAVILVRLVFRKAPKAIICVLWALVGLRLLCPISIESSLSVVPDAKPVTYISDYVNVDSENESDVLIDKNVISYQKSDGSSVVATEEVTRINYAAVIGDLLPYVWLGGVGVMTIISVISYIRLRRSMLVSINHSGNVWRCDGIKSPFILGIIKPKIYVPSHLDEAQLRVVVSHEKAHLKRLDHIWKPLGYLVLTLHWFNPLVWVAYAMLCKDIESACDERVVRLMNTEDKKLYSATLLTCSAPKHMLTACPVAFGEISVKQRVRSVLNYKKPGFWIVLAAVLVCAVVAVIFMTNPVNIIPPSYSTEIELLRETILKENENDFTSDYFACESHEILKVEDLRTVKSYYMLVMYGEYGCDGKTVTMDGAGAYYPAVITINKLASGKLEVMEYWEPEDGERYADSVKSKFPYELHNKVLLGTSYSTNLQKENEKQAYEYFGIEKTVVTSGNYPRFQAEVRAVEEDAYVVAPLKGEGLFDDELWGLIYVSRDAAYGGDEEYSKGDIISISYKDELKETDAPVLNNVESIALCQKVYDRIPTYDANFFFMYDGKEISRYMVIDAETEPFDRFEVYRFTTEEPEFSDIVEENVSETVEAEFAPYLLLDCANGFATFEYARGYTLIGTYDDFGDKIVMTARYKGSFYSASNSPSEENVYVFNKVENGYAFDAENSALINTYYQDPETGEPVNALPGGTVFMAEFDII